MFCPGETIKHSFLIPFNINDISKVIVSYKARDDIFFEKVITPESARFNENFISEDSKHTIVKYTLDQEESLLFPEDMKYQMQVNVLTRGGSRHASKFIESKEYFQHIQNIISVGYESEGMSIVKEAYYTVFGYPN